MTVPKWNEERTTQLTDSVGSESPVSNETVARLAEELETSTRSVSSKLRKLGYEVSPAGAAQKAFSDEQTEELREFLEQNEGQMTYGEIAEAFSDGEFSARSIQGKILSMELTSMVKETPKPETTRTYTDEEQETVLSMIKDGRFVEEIAEAVGKSVASVRGKALSLFKEGTISAVPAQRDHKATAADPLEGLDVAELTVEEIVERTGKTERGIKGMLTRRQLTAKNYDGAAKAAKRAAAE